MPSIRTWGKLNRSQASVGSSNENSAPLSSVGASAQEPHSQRYQASADERHLAYGHLPPAREPSQRHSSNLSIDRPPINVSAAVSAAESSSPSVERAPDHRYSYQLHSPQQQYSSQEPRKSIRSRIFGSSNRETSDQLSTGSSGTNRIARKVSLRKSDNPDQGRYQLSPEEQHRIQAQQWQQRQVNNPNLTITSDRDESNLDPFLQQGGGRSPVDVVVQSPSYQAYQQPLSQDSNIQRPTLARVSTDQSFNTQGDKKYSPDQQSINQQPPQYQAYSQPDQTQVQQPVPGQQVQYQAFQPAPQVSPLPGQTSHLQQPTDEDQAHLYYQQQQPQSQQPQQPQQPQQSQQQQQFQHQQPQVQSQQPQPVHQSQQPQIVHQSPLDDSYLIQQQHQQHQQQFQQFQHQQLQQQDQQQLLHQNQQQQEFHPQAQQSGRPTSQQQHQPPQEQLLQQVPVNPQQLQQDPQLLQSNQQSNQHLNPPSPASQQYHGQDLQNAQQAPSSPADTGSLSSVQNQMPSSGQQRQSLRTDRTLSRENSGLQQGQVPQGSNPGMAAYGANVVPQTSQGQPYKGGRGPSDENGRATPDPSISEMTEEDVQQLLKEHEVLREKYQKVKRYFFDQQSQVHQLQNTLANQRLSQSRTSLDDSEYATRFNRLEGLISQLAFNLRRSWKTIPHWLQPGVNKDAITIKKQEMTAVGRAFISCWLVDEIFDKFFHPDLEPSLSCQLKMIQNNIRRIAPHAQSVEDEEGLTSKIVNWRLATMEGLADLLRSQQQGTTRARLVETLNEKLIAALEMHLEEPAPPDLAGGVPMIIELAVGIMGHLPLESRDVQIEYYPPGHPLVPDLMKVETGIPALTAPCFEPGDVVDKASTNSAPSDGKESFEQDPGNQGKEEKRARGMFGGLMAPKKPIPTGSSQQNKLAGGGSQVSLTQRPESANGPRDDQPPKVRFAIGIAVQIRGRSVLAKSSVYST